MSSNRAFPRLRDVENGTPDTLRRALDDLGAEPTREDLAYVHNRVRLALGLLPPAVVALRSTPSPVHVAVKSSMGVAKWGSMVVVPVGIGALAAAAMLWVIAPGLPATSLPVVATASSPSMIESAPVEAPRAPSAVVAPTAPSLPTLQRPVSRELPKRPVADDLTASPLEKAPAIEVAPSPEVGAGVAPSISELDLLALAQGSLSTNARKALDLADLHARRFLNGMLAQEREVIAIDALLRLGRKGDAVERARLFHDRFPRSPHGRRVDVLVQANGDESK